MALKRWLPLAAALFAGGFFLGLLLPAGAVDQILETFKEMIGDAPVPSGWSLFFFLLLNNAIALSLSFFFSPLFLILPVMSLLLNGALISVVGLVTLEENSVGFLVAGILPHGVIEIPAFLLAQAAALCFGFNILRGIFQSRHREAIAPAFKTSLRWLGIALVLLIPAALIEAFITPLLLGLFD